MTLFSINCGSNLLNRKQLLADLYLYKLQICKNYKKYNSGCGNSTKYCRGNKIPLIIQKVNINKG